MGLYQEKIIVRGNSIGAAYFIRVTKELKTHRVVSYELIDQTPISPKAPHYEEFNRLRKAQKKAWLKNI